MRTGRHEFDRVLDAVCEALFEGAAAGSQHAAGGGARVRCSYCPAPDDGRAPASADAGRWEAALAWLGEDAADRRPDRSVDDGEVTPERLGIVSDLTPAELKRLRREFALRNHPDRCHPSLRPEATRRMTSANMLIDAALERRSRR